MQNIIINNLQRIRSHLPPLFPHFSTPSPFFPIPLSLTSIFLLLFSLNDNLSHYVIRETLSNSFFFSDFLMLPLSPSQQPHSPIPLVQYSPRSNISPSLLFQCSPSSMPPQQQSSSCLENIAAERLNSSPLLSPPSCLPNDDCLPNNNDYPLCCLPPLPFS